MKNKIKDFFSNKKKRRAVIAITALLVVTGITAYVLAAPGFISPYSDAKDYACVSPARFVFPDNTIVYAPQVNYTMPDKNVDNGKNALFVDAATAASSRLKTALDLVGIPVVNGQYQMFNSGSIKPNFFIGFKLTGSGGYDLYPSNLRPITDASKRREAYDVHTKDEYDITAMQPSVSSWYNSGKYQINLRYPDGYYSNGTGAPTASGYALDAYFLPPDFSVQAVWTTPMTGGVGNAHALFENNFPADVRVNVYLYAVVNGKHQLIASDNPYIPALGRFPLDGNYPAGTTKLVACIGAPWNGASWQSSVDANTTSMTCEALGLTLTGKKIELGSDLYRSDTKAALANRWVDNYMEQTDLLNYTGPPDDYWDNLVPGGNVGPNDLAATRITVYDAKTGTPISNPEPNQPLNVKVEFVSTFDVGGFARLRLYRYQVDAKVLSPVESAFNVYLEPGAIIEHQWNGYIVGTGQYRFIATIDLERTGNDPENDWRAELFDGIHNESNYTNNKIAYGLVGADMPDVIPSPGYWTTGPGYYPPMKAYREPVYEKVPIYGWKRVDYESIKPKIKTRLVE